MFQLEREGGYKLQLTSADLCTVTYLPYVKAWTMRFIAKACMFVSTPSNPFPVRRWPGALLSSLLFSYVLNIQLLYKSGRCGESKQSDNANLRDVIAFNSYGSNIQARRVVFGHPAVPYGAAWLRSTWRVPPPA